MIRDTLERLFWTVVAAGGGSLIAGPLLGVSAWQAAGVAGLSAGVNFVTILARQRLAVLPSPGEGLPGLPTDDRGAITLQTVVLVLVGLVALVWLAANVDIVTK